MSKSIIKITAIASAAIMLAATLSAAEARGGGGGGGGRGGGGGGMRMSSHGSHNNHHHHRRFLFVTPVVTPRVYEAPVVRRVAAPVVAAPAAILKIADAKGRTFDVASKVWFDGVDRCYAGRKTFALKAGDWFYGDAKWYEQDGTWRTGGGAEAPATVDCKTVPVFAARMQSPSGEQKVAAGTGFEKDGAIETEPGKVQVGQIQDNQAETPKKTDCKKYFPSVGETLPVPCQ